jgi:lipopolysaccharide biosynthesis glycosyltransferase
LAPQDLWIWHYFFGMANSHNSYGELWDHNAYDKPYYLVDGIYPDWTTLVKTIHNPQIEKEKRFFKMQEACRKDVERTFGVLQT